MSKSQARTRFAIVGVVSLLAAGTTLAQPPQTTAYWISFPSGSTALHQADQETIGGVAAMMKRDPALFAMIMGKADSVGTPEYNDRLSKKRADAVFNALVYKNQVPATRVHIHWTGEHLPNVPTKDQQAELQNRVVMINISTNADR